MEQKISLKQIEKKVYLTYHGDGLWDIFLGLFFISIAVFMILDVPYLMGIVPATMLPPVMNAKKSFTRPRLGYVKFSPERKAKEKKGISGMLLVFTLTAIAGVVAFMAFTGDSAWQTTIQNLGMIPFGAVLAVVIGAVGLFFGMKRFTIYSALILAIFFAGHYANSDPPVQFILLGIIMLIVGLVMFIRFVRKYPGSEKGAPYVG